MGLRVNALRRVKYHNYLLIQEKKADSFTMTLVRMQFLYFERLQNCVQNVLIYFCWCFAFQWCAARAFYDCPAIISLRPRSQNILKEAQLNPENQCLGECIWRVCHVGKAWTRENHLPNSGAKDSRPRSGGRAGWSAVWYISLTGWKKPAQFRMKVVSDVLLLSYLDKFGLRVTVEAGQACVFI